MARLPRFKRAPGAPAIELTERDREILRQVNRHRFLRSSHLLSLIPGSPQQILRRLKLLYHHGYLERPRSQLDYYHQGGSREIVYGLGSRSATLFEPDNLASRIHWSEKNGSVKRIFLEHALLVSDFMVAMELACQKVGIRFIAEHELATGVNSRTHEVFQWPVNIGNGVKLKAEPDAVFALEFPTSTGTAKRAYFFLEADRGTMPVVRKSLLQTSFYRKLLAYEATWLEKIHEKRLGFPRFRVLTVTTTAARVGNILAACAKLKHGRGLFLFADQTVLDEPNQILSTAWKTGKGNTSRLLD